MAHKKAGGSTALGRDSHGQRLGVKIPDGAPVLAGQIIVRQRGTHLFPAQGVSRGSDDTLFATAKGTVKFTTRHARRFDGALKARKFVQVI